MTLFPERNQRQGAHPIGRGAHGLASRRIDSTAKWLLKFRIIRGPARLLANSRFAWSFVSELIGFVQIVFEIESSEDQFLNMYP